MKALVLSAGLGTRLRPLTNKIPKVMVEVGGKPVLWYHLTLLKKYGIKDIWINLHAHPRVIQDYFGDGSSLGININYSIEKKLLGTAGALKNPTSGIEKEFAKNTFLVVYGDNLTNFDHSRLIDFHRDKQAFLSVGLYKSPEPWTMGIVETDKKGCVLKIIEKPPKEKVTTDTVSAGVLVCEPEVLNLIPNGFSDFGFDINPKLIRLKKRLFALNTGSYVQDTGTAERLAKARRDFVANKVNIDNF